MRRWIAILAMLLPLTLQAQRDTVSHRLRPRVMPLVGASLYSAGTLISIRPEFHDHEISLYDKFGLADAKPLHFDDYLQFVPSLMPYVLHLAGLESEHNPGQVALLTGTACLVGLAAIETGKLLYQVPRPDGSANTSFPSGHTFAAVAGAEVLRREYGKRHPWVAYVSYGMAALVGVMRMYNSRHWFSDVLGGAGLGILSVSVSYYLWN
ncbi:MAG: phosphatase PAP2 family protein [Bacteroidales bacterium]|nr:phosphatase PAP2 family protein [Bacteroidales bacterium]